MTGTEKVSHRWRRRATLAVAGTLACLAIGNRAHAGADTAGRIERLQLEGNGPSTKVIIALSKPIAFDIHVLDADAAKKTSRRLVLDFPDTTLGPEATKPIAVGNELVRQVRAGQYNAKTARVVVELASDAKHSVDAFETPPHVTIAFGGAATVGMPAPGTLLAPRAAIDGIDEPTRAVTGAASEPPKAAAPDAPEASKTVDAESSDAPKAAVTGAAGAPSSGARNIPIRARGRRPYSLNYSR